VSLDLCTDWMLARAMGNTPDRTRVVALSPYHRHYPVAWVGEDWPYHDGSLEQILRLKPDLILVGEYNALQVRRRLQALGQHVEVLPLPKSLDAVAGYERRFLALLELTADQAQRSVPPAAGGSAGRRLLLLGANGIGTGRGTFEDGVLKHAGWHNYLEDPGYVRLDLERLVTDPPDAILWAAPASRALANQFAEHPVLKRAVPIQRWLSTDYWRWQCPGPWTWELSEQLQRMAAQRRPWHD